MTETPSPSTLRTLAANLRASATGAQIDGILAHAEAWEAERADRAAQAEQLVLMQKRMDVLEQDRRWWQDNAIKRRKRAEARRSGR